MAENTDNKAFNYMTTAVADNTAVDLLTKPDRINSGDVHNMLMAAGFAPGLGNIADAADAILYAAEGEFGSAAISTAAMIPFIGQAVSAKKALKVAKESGEKMRTFYRGVEEWHPARHKLTRGKYAGEIINTGETMVKDGKFIGGGGYIKEGHGVSKNALWATEDLELAQRYLKGNPDGVLLEFEVPESVFNESFTKLMRSSKGYGGIFDEGLDKVFLTKVHK